MQDDFINRTIVIIFLMAHANRKHTKRYGSRSSGFRRNAVMAEQFSKARLEHLRIMVLRGEYEPVIWHIKNESDANLGYLEKLLEDDGIGVGENAAEILEELVRRKVDIGSVVPALEKAFENQYVRENAARALAAHHLRRVNIRKLEELLKHNDPVIKQAAEEIVSGERSQNSDQE
jgi:hypothetical protein